MKKTLLVTLLAGFAVQANAERLATVLEFDGDVISANELAKQVDPRNIKAVKQHTLLADGLFHFDSADIKRLTRNDNSFRDLATEAKANNYIIRIDAFADELGTQSYNQNLSQRRAKAVANYFNQALNVPYSQMTYQGWGENYPVVKCPTNNKKLMKDKISRKQIIDCLAPNRRVTISLLN